MKLWHALAFVFGVTAIIFGLTGSCSTVKPACQIIDLVDNACVVFAVQGPDGGKVLVPAESLGAKPCPSTAILYVDPKLYRPDYGAMLDRICDAGGEELAKQCAPRK
jgi:hypothetical protein